MGRRVSGKRKIGCILFLEITQKTKTAHPPKMVFFGKMPRFYLPQKWGF